MKTKLVIEESTASLVVEAETEFEREMLKQVESFKDHSLQISTEQNWGTTVKGHVVVTFCTNPPNDKSSHAGTGR